MTRDSQDTGRAVRTTMRGWLGVDRSRSAAEVRDLLASGRAHVHVQGPPGYGKRDTVAALGEQLEGCAVIVRLDEAGLGADPLLCVWNALRGSTERSQSWSDYDWEQGWAAIIGHLSGQTGQRPILIFQGAEHLLPEGTPPIWPAGLLDWADVVTVSLAPLHLIFPSYSRQAAEECTVELRAFPAPADEYGDDAEGGNRWNAQQLDAYHEEGGAWFERYLRSRAAVAERAETLRRVFAAKYFERKDELWGGHPLINMAVLEDMLDEVLAGGRARAALDRWWEDLPNLGKGALAARLLPFTPGRDGGVSPFVAEAVAEAVACMAEGRTLDEVQKQWLLASGWAEPRALKGELVWTRAAGLITPARENEARAAALTDWARKTAFSARQARRFLAERRQHGDRGFRAAMDQVEAMFCETEAGAALDTRVERAASRVIVPEHMYSFRLSFRPSNRFESADREEQVEAKRASYDILVFETAGEGTHFWRHQIRVLSMLGRMRHPSLIAFSRGGELRVKGDAESPETRVFIKIERPLERLPAHSLHELAAALPRSGTEGDDAAYRQIADLAEALDLVHAQGILHRSLDFTALAIDRNGERPQLVLTGFEYSANIRSEIRRRRGNALVAYRQAVWNLACRAPEAGFGMGDEIEPVIDVYSFGALAIMLATGLPDLEILAEVDKMLPVRFEPPDAQMSRKDGETLENGARLLREDLLRSDRWPEGDDAMQRLRAILEPCLALDPGRRPVMEDIAPRLRGWHADYQAARVRADEVLYASYSETAMGEMLKHMQFIDPDKNLQSVEGRAFLQTKLQGWINAAKWMHFRESGFPKHGTDEAEYVRRGAKYILAGKNVVFFASLFRSSPGARLDPSLLWLAYAARRDDISLPDPEDPNINSVRTTTEEITWIARPAHVEVRPRAEVSALIDPPSWQPTLDDLERRGRLAGRRRLGREAATVWRLHRDIQIALEAVRSFPVIVEAEHGAEPDVCTLKLDEDAFRRANETGALSFLRQVILEGENLRAFFVDTVQALAEEESAGQLSFVLLPRLKRGRSKRRRVVGSVILPVRDNKVQMKVQEQDEEPLPREAQIMWFSSFGTQAAVERQSLAIERLERRTWLMDYLVTPRDGEQLVRPVSASCGTMLAAPQERIDELRERVRVMLSSDPLHAVQGPPGTGKTTLIAALVAEVLRGEDGSRLLITSQSHAATDNVLLSVMSNLNLLAQREGREDWAPATALRLFSESTRDTVDHKVRQHYSIDAQVQAAQARMKASAERDGGGSGAWMRKAREFLGRAARDSYLETRYKIERSSPLIFATTGAAMTSVDYLRRGAIGFDYVLIDEAARAFSIDLIQPMALADRVIWVGDQAQLPPYGEMELDRFLEKARARRDMDQVPPDIDFLLDRSRDRDTADAPYDRMKSWLKLFHRTFEKCPPAIARLPNSERIPLTQSLDRQFRSVEAIGRLVAETFYGSIEIKHSGPSPDSGRRLSIPLAPEGTGFAPAVVWIDTSELNERRFFTRRGLRGRMENSGEADLVAHLLRTLHGQQERADPWERLRVLSPYKAQVAKLAAGFSERPAELGVSKEELPRLFQTVDAAQGSEADIVLISFCRRFDFPGFAQAAAGQSRAARRESLKRQINGILGFLQFPERINVMMSRARHQIILLGDYSYYRRGAALVDQMLELEEGDPFRTSFWTALLQAFVPFDPAVHLTPDGLEQPAILPARRIVGAPI